MNNNEQYHWEYTLQSMSSMDQQAENIFLCKQRGANNMVNFEHELEREKVAHPSCSLFVNVNWK